MKTTQEMALEVGGMFTELPMMDAWVFDANDKSLEAFAKLVEAPLRRDIEELLQENKLLRARNDRLEGKPIAQPQYSLEEYDAGLLNDFGGGNVEWWQDYIRAELGHAYEHYQSQMPAQPAQPQQEPVTKVIGKFLTRKDELRTCIEPELPLGTSLYTSPPPVATQHERTWVNDTTWRGLTEEEAEDIYRIVRPDVMKFWRECEAKLKEKNT